MCILSTPSSPHPFAVSAPSSLLEDVSRSGEKVTHRPSEGGPSSRSTRRRSIAWNGRCMPRPLLVPHLQQCHERRPLPALHRLQRVEQHGERAAAQATALRQQRQLVCQRLVPSSASVVCVASNASSSHVARLVLPQPVGPVSRQAAGLREASHSRTPACAASCPTTSSETKCTYGESIENQPPRWAIVHHLELPGSRL